MVSLKNLFPDIYQDETEDDEIYDKIYHKIKPDKYTYENLQDIINFKNTPGNNDKTFDQCVTEI